MPREPVRPYSDIYNALIDKPIFFEDKTLKKERHADADGYEVWTQSVIQLKPMLRHSLYSYVQGNRKEIQTELRKAKFPTFISPNPTADSSQTTNASEDSQSQNCSNVEENPSSDEHSEEKNLSCLPDEHDSLCRMKIDVSYSSSMLQYAIDPFCIIIYSGDQTSVYKELVKRDTCICLTILRGVIDSVKMRNHISGKNNIVSICARNEKNKIVLIGHKICDSLKDNKIAHFVEDFLTVKESIPLPKKICMEYNVSLVNEMCVALNECTFIDYVNKCLIVITEKEKQSKKDSLKLSTISEKSVLEQKEDEPSENFSLRMPPVLLFIDLISILFEMKGSNILASKLAIVRKFYLKCIILLSLKETLQEFKTAVKSILIVLLSPHDDDQVTKTRSLLETELDSSSVLSWYEKFDSYTTNKELITALSIKKDKDVYITEYIQNLVSEVLPNTEAQPNSYYSPEWYDNEFGPLLSVFVSWTNLFLDDITTIDLMTDISAQHLELISKKKECCENFTDLLKQHIIESNDTVDVCRSMLNNRRKRKAPVEDKLLYPKKSTYEENWKGRNRCYKAPADLYDEQKNNDLSANFEQSFNVEKDNSKSPSHMLTTKEKNEAIKDSKSHEIEKNVKSDFESLLESSVKELDKSNVCEIGIDFEPIANSSSLDNCNTCSDPEHSTQSISSKYHRSLVESESLEKGDGSVLKDEYPAFSTSNDNNEKVISNDNLVLEENETYVDVNNLVSVTVPVQALPNKSATMRSRKYLDPCPNMKLKHDQAVKNGKKDVLIRNAKSLLPRSIDKDSYAFDDSSKFDAIAEIFSFAYKNFLSFQTICLQDLCFHSCEKKCMIQTIKKFCISGSASSLQKARGDLLYKYATIDKKLAKITIEGPLPEFFSKIMYAHPSFSLMTTCELCKKTNIIDECVIRLKISELANVKQLDKLLCSFFMNYCLQSTCSENSNHVVETYYSWHSYLYIDIEANLPDDSILPMPPYYIDISTIPGVINSYIMVGVITLKPDNSFAAYCRTLQGLWSKRDGTEKSIKACRPGTDKIVSFVYTKLN